MVEQKGFNQTGKKTATCTSKVAAGEEKLSVYNNLCRNDN